MAAVVVLHVRAAGDALGALEGQLRYFVKRLVLVVLAERHVDEEQLGEAAGHYDVDPDPGDVVGAEGAAGEGGGEEGEDGSAHFEFEIRRWECDFKSSGLGVVRWRCFDCFDCL